MFVFCYIRSVVLTHYIRSALLDLFVNNSRAHDAGQELMRKGGKPDHEEALGILILKLELEWYEIVVADVHEDDGE